MKRRGFKVLNRFFLLVEVTIFRITILKVSLACALILVKLFEISVTFEVRTRPLKISRCTFKVTGATPS